jgi:hypothetical protein
MKNSINMSDVLKTALSETGKIAEYYSAFHSYSIGNMFAAVSQLKTRNLPISPIASYKAWQDKGRSVKKGQKAIALCMPITCKETDNQTGVEITFSLFAWKNNWFSLDQTEGQDFKNEITSPSWDNVAALKKLEITEGKFHHHDGNYQGYASGRMIAINPVAGQPHKTRFHEMAHIVLGHTAESTMNDSPTTPRDMREVEAESVAYILCSILGLPGIEESRGYIQSWLSSTAIPEKSAQKIFSAADKILKAGKI